MNYSCEKCGMPATHKYIDKTGIVHYFAKHHAPEGSILIETTPKSKLVNISEDKGLGILSLKSYIPLIVIISLIIITSLISEIRESSFDISSFIINFMAGFFLVFGGIKLFDLPGFANGYSTYDIIASRFKTYGYIYPFIEISFGLLMLAGIHTIPILLAEMVIMVLGGIGVLIKILRKEEFMCVCLGTVLKVPLTYVTLVENFGMALLAGISIYFLI